MNEHCSLVRLFRPHLMNQVDKPWRRALHAIWKIGIREAACCAGHSGARSPAFLMWPTEGLKDPLVGVVADAIITYQRFLGLTWELTLQVGRSGSYWRLAAACPCGKEWDSAALGVVRGDVRFIALFLDDVLP